MPRYTALLDACTLAPIALADTLLRIAEKGLYRPLWSDRILAEAQDAIEEIHPGIDVQKRFTDMRDAFDDALVTGWEELESAISLPDNDDRHVVAAAILGGAQAIVTFNISDFPATTLAPLGLQAVDPDTFLQDQLDLTPSTVVQVIREQAAHTRSPRLSASQLAGVLRRAGVPSLADEILRRMSAPLNDTTE